MLSFSKQLGRSFFRSAVHASRRRRLKHVGRTPYAAEVLESRLLLSATLSVDPTSHSPGVFHTIQAAVNAAPSGSTIKVAPGTYNEDVTISKSLTLLGGQVLSRGEQGPSIVEYEATGFTVASANNVTINGFTIEADPASSTSTGHAIFATNSVGSTFEHNVIVGSSITFGTGLARTDVAYNSDPSGSSFDIVVNGSTPGADADDTFLNNTLYNGGISLDVSATGALVQGNTATDGPQIVNGADNVTVSHNVSDGADEGFVDTGNNNTYIDNTADNNGIGFGFTGGGTLIVIGNVAITNTGDGFIVAGSSTLKLTMKGNTANNNASTGFDIGGGSPTLTDDTANGNGVAGISIACQSASVTDCTTNNTPVGISIAALQNVTIVGNTADNDSNFGIELAIGGGTVSYNIANDGEGINGGSAFSISALGSLNFIGNQADNNASVGFTISMQGGTVSDNTADANGFYGFEMGANGASIEHNTANNNGVDGFDLELVGGTVSGNTAIGNQGSASDLGAGFLFFGGEFSATNNTARNNAGDGFQLYEATHVTLSGNTANNNHADGIHLMESSTDTLSHNTADNNGNDGIDLESSAFNTVSNNTAFGNNVDDLVDDSTGTGTAGTGNTWTHNSAHTTNPPGL